MTRLFACLLACLALLVLPACGSRAERTELRDDTARFRQGGAVEAEQLKRDFNRYAIDQKLRTQELPIDVDHFLEWRHREWWNLTDEMANLVAYDWQTVEALSQDAARFYGYEIRNFPKVGDDVARFFARADPGWRGLVRDACVFVEWRNSKLPLRTDLRMAYERLAWEAGNMQIDLAQFCSWREREWSKLSHESAAFMAWEREQGERLRQDLRRFRAARAIEANYLAVDFKAWWFYEAQAMPPRLISDVCRWSTLPPQELARLGDDVSRFGETIPDDAIKLIDDLARFFDAQVDQVPMLVADVDRFFDVYERERRPLSGDVRRFWRTNVGLGIFLREDMQLFLIEHGRTETAEMQASLHRFVSYAGKEWKDFRGALDRFLWDDSGRAFGDRGIPRNGDRGGVVFDDPRAYPVRGYDVGNE